MAQVDNLTLEVKADVTKATNSLDSLSKSLLNLKTNMGSMVSGYKSLTKQLSKISTSVGNLKNIKDLSKSLNSLNTVRAKNIENTASSLRSLSDSIKGISLAKTNIQKIKEIRKIGDSLIGLNSINANNIKKSADGVTVLSSALNTISVDSISKLERICDALSKIPAGTSSIKGIARMANSTSTVATKTGQTSSSSRVGTGQIPDTSQMGKAADDTQKTIGLFATLKALKVNPVVNGITTALGTLGKAFKKVISPITRFVKALARIAFYRFIRGILKTISQGIQEGIQNLALYSKTMEELDAHSANNVMSRYASEFLYLKNAIATAVIPVLRGLIPIVEEVTNKIIKLIDVIAQFGSAFFGTQYTKANYYWLDYADSLDKASGSAKALHHQLAGFDELNNLTDSNRGGSGASPLDYSDMFGEAEIDSKIQKFADKIKNAVEKIKAVVTPFIEKLKEFWNRIVDKVSPSLSKIWANLKRIWAVVKPLFESFGSGYIQGFKDNFDIESLPDDLGKIAETIAFLTDVVAYLFEKMDLEKLKNFAEKFGYLNGKIFAVINPVSQLATAIEWFATACRIGEAWGNKLAQAIVNNMDKIIAFKIKLDELKEKLHPIKSAVDTLAGAIEYLRDKISEFVIRLTTTAFSSNNVFTKAKDVAEKVRDMIQFVIDKIANFKSAVNTTGHAGVFSSANTVADVLKNTIETIIKLINTLNGMSATIKVNLEGAIASGFSGSALSGVADAVKNIVDNTKETIKTATSSSVASTGHTPTSQPSGYQYGNPNQQVKSLAELKKRASGGYVPNGDLFLANEKGAEFIGAIGGNTAVANNNQITEAIAQATYTAMSQALSENGGSVNIVVEGDADRMFKVFQKKQREATRTTGFAY